MIGRAPAPTIDHDTQDQGPPGGRDRRPAGEPSGDVNPEDTTFDAFTIPLPAEFSPQINGRLQSGV